MLYPGCCNGGATCTLTVLDLAQSSSQNSRSKRISTLTWPASPPGDWAQVLALAVLHPVWAAQAHDAAALASQPYRSPTRQERAQRAITRKFARCSELGSTSTARSVHGRIVHIQQESL